MIEVIKVEEEEVEEEEDWSNGDGNRCSDERAAGRGSRCNEVC